MIARIVFAGNGKPDNRVENFRHHEIWKNRHWHESGWYKDPGKSYRFHRAGNYAGDRSMTIRDDMDIYIDLGNGSEVFAAEILAAMKECGFSEDELEIFRMDQNGFLA